MKYGVLGFSYHHYDHFRTSLADDGYYTVNLGDNAQSIATRHVYRHLGVPDESMVLISRDTLPSYDGEPAVLLTNGVFREFCFPLPPRIIPIFVGFHAKESVIVENLRTFKQHEPIGCRDTVTTEIMRANGVDAYTSGCITLALPARAKVPPQRKLFIVYGSGAGELPAKILKHIPDDLADTAEFVFHRLPVGTFPLSTEQCLNAEAYEADLMRQFRDRATVVLTPLHHVATPCMAMGVPVIVCRKQADARFSFLQDLIPIYTPKSFDRIDWNPSPADVDRVRANLIRSVENALHAATRLGVQ